MCFAFFFLVSENLDKGKSILGAPPKQDKKEAKNPRTKKANSQKPSSIFVIIVELLIILNKIAISG